ncbi:peroxidase TAP [Coniochaeta sp. 2T2.1]|nr:peroxidase TAP [Coniochaeta sp. 2T2.1]
MAAPTVDPSKIQGDIQNVADGRQAIFEHAKQHGGLLPIGFTNIAFSAAGLGKGEWKSEFTGGRIHGVILVGGDSAGTIAAKTKEALDILGDTVKEVVRVAAIFGYRDGISHPAVEGLDNEDRSEQGFVQPGVFVLGRPGDKFKDERPDWAVDRSFLAFRYLVQHVPEFDSAVKKQAALVSDPPHNLVELMGARMVGRWKSGAPLPEATRVDQALALDEARLNNFDDYGGMDQGVCPFAAHTRKMNPRGDLDREEIDPHRILRRGIPFGPEVGSDEKAAGKTKPGRERGLLFASYQSSLDGDPGSHGGFAFLQKSWANNKNFPINKSVVPGLDPLIGATGAALRPMSGLVIGKPKDNSLLDRWVVPMGGEYFFVPSIKTLSAVFAKVRSAQQSDL